jgi:hypothetical protein
MRSFAYDDETINVLSFSSKVVFFFFFFHIGRPEKRNDDISLNDITPPPIVDREIQDIRVGLFLIGRQERLVDANNLLESIVDE